MRYNTFLFIAAFAWPWFTERWQVALACNALSIVVGILIVLPVLAIDHLYHRPRRKE